MVAKKNVRLAAREMVQRYNYDPLEVLVIYAQEAGTPDQAKVEIAQCLLPYLYPKLSNVVMEGEISTTNVMESQAALLRRVLENPELADAAQRLSIAAAEGLDCRAFGSQ